MALKSATTTLTTIQMRRGLEEDFDPDQMTAGEWAVSTNKKYVRMCFMPGLCLRMATYEAFEKDMEEIRQILVEAQDIHAAIERWNYLAESYAHGGTGKREGEDTDNAKYYAEQAKASADKAESLADIGIMTTEKAGIGKPDGTTITVDADGTMHSAGGGMEESAVTGVKGSIETTYRNGNVSISPENLGITVVNNTNDSDKNVNSAKKDGSGNIITDSYAVRKIITSGSYNDITVPGLYTVKGTSVTDGPNDGGNYHGLIVLKSGTGNYVEQIAFKESSYSLWVRYISGSAAHEWKQLLSSDSADSLYAKKAIYSDTYVSMGRKTGTAIGSKSFAYGVDVTASGANSHSEGSYTTADGSFSHAEGNQTAASGGCSHAEGYKTKVYGISGMTISCGHAEGYEMSAYGCMHAQGHYGDSSKLGVGGITGTTGDAFYIGNGTPGAKSNAVRIGYNGKLWCKQAYSSTGADYAELFEWADGNIDNEDRRGYFVTIDGKKIRKAESGDYILGIISGNPSVIGNTDMEWYGQFMRDEFGTFIKETYKETVKEPSVDEDGNVTEEEREVDVEFYRVNPDYDPDAPYTFRLDRPEWDAVGMLGVLPVCDDGTCEVGKFCRCAGGGIATLAEERGLDTYMVIERVTENIVSVVLK